MRTGATWITLQHTQRAWPKVLESHTATSEGLALTIRLAFQSKGETEGDGRVRKKEHGMGLRGWLASLWNGAVAEAGMQVWKHSVELRVQLLTRKEGSRGEVSGWLTERVPRTQTQNNAQSYGGLSETTGALAIDSKRFLIVYWDCLRGAMHPPSMLRAKGAAGYHSASGRKTCSTSADPVDSLVHDCRFIIERPKDRHAFKAQRGWQTQSGGEANRHRCFRRGTQTDKSSLGHRSRFQTLFWVLLIKLRMIVSELNHCRGLEWIEMSHDCVADRQLSLKNSPVISINGIGQSVWNTAELSWGHGGGLLSGRLEGETRGTGLMSW